MLKRNLRAGVLYYTLFVALVMLLIVGLFVLIAYQEGFFMSNLKRSERISSYFSSALALCLANPNPDNYSKKTTLFENDNESTLEIAQFKWGFYNVLTIKTTELPTQISKSYLVGITPNDTIRQTGLYLRNNYSYLSVSGSTLLTGRTYLPQSGIASSSIEGNGYTSDSLLYGLKLLSKDKLPSYYINRLESVIGRLESIKSEGGMPTKLRNTSFSNPTSVIDISDNIPNLSIEGNVIIRSKNKLILNRKSKLKNVIVFAPSVYIENEFKGCCQIFATDTVIIQSGAVLHYPSGIAILSNSRGYLEVDSTSRIYGYAIVHSQDNAKIGLRIKSSAAIFGYTFCNSKVDHQGTVFGSLYAYGLEFRTGWGLYTSSLFNAKVLGRELSPCYLFPFVSPGRKAVIVNLP